MHKGKKIIPYSTSQKLKHNLNLNIFNHNNHNSHNPNDQSANKVKYKKISGCLEGFIPTNFIKSKK
jgi:hypothetical protein